MSFFPEKAANFLFQRELLVKEKIRSDDFIVQDIYFDTNASVAPSLDAVLNTSVPDTQVYKIIEEISEYGQKNPGLSPREQRALAQAVEKLEKTKTIALLTSKIIQSNSVEEQEEIRTYLSKIIQEQVAAMQDNDEILIPCGYMNGSVYDTAKLLKGEVKGHSVLIKLKKDSGLFTATLYNAGDGAEDHALDIKHPERVYPLVFSDLSSNVLNPSFLDDLTKFSYNYAITQNTGHLLNEFLFTKLGRPRAINPLTDRSYAKQNTENCIKKSIHSWLQDELHDHKKLYQKIRLQALNDKTKQLSAIIAKTIGDFQYQHPLALVSKPGFEPTHIRMPIGTPDLKELASVAKNTLEKREARLKSAEVPVPPSEESSVGEGIKQLQAAQPKPQAVPAKPASTPMEQARKLCEDKGYTRLVVPQGSIPSTTPIMSIEDLYRRSIEASKLPITMCGFKAQIGLYIENSDQFTEAVKEFTEFLCQSTLPEITGAIDDPYQSLAGKPMGRYDKVALYLEGGEGKIGLLSLQQFALRPPRNLYNQCLDAIRLFPRHLEEIIGVVKTFYPEVEESRQLFTEESKEALQRFKVAYEDHVEFVKNKGITIENPTAFEKLTPARIEELKKAIEIKLNTEFKDCLGENSDTTLALFNEIALPKILDTFYKIMELSLRYNLAQNKKPPSSDAELLSIRTLMIKNVHFEFFRKESFDLMHMFNTMQQSMLGKYDAKESLQDELLHTILEELAKGKEICYYNPDFSYPRGPSIRECIFC